VGEHHLLSAAMSAATAGLPRVGRPAVATAEALLLGQRAGIDPAVLRHALVDSPAASTLICSDIGLVFRGDYLSSLGLARLLE